MTPTMPINCYCSNLDTVIEYEYDNVATNFNLFIIVSHFTPG